MSSEFCITLSLLSSSFLNPFLRISYHTIF